MPTLGVISLEIKYEPPPPGDRIAGTLHVYIREARNLCPSPADPNTKALPSPYVKLYLSENGKDLKNTKQKTKCQKSTLDPLFEERFVFYLPAKTELTQTSRLQLTIWNNAGRHLGANECLGATSFSFEDIASTTSLDGWFVLMDEAGGRMCFSRGKEPQGSSTLRRSGSTRSLFAKRAVPSSKLSDSASLAPRRGRGGAAQTKEIDFLSNSNKASLSTSEPDFSKFGKPKQISDSTHTSHSDLGDDEDNEDNAGGNDNDKDDECDQKNEVNQNPEAANETARETASEKARTERNSSGEDEKSERNPEPLRPNDEACTDDVEETDELVLANDELSLNEQLSEFSKREGDALRELGIIAKQINEMEQENEALREENEAALEEIENAQQEVKRGKTISKLQQENEVLRQKVREAKEAVERVRKTENLRKDDLMHQISTLSEQVDKLENSDLMKQNNQLKDQIQQVNEQLRAKCDDRVGELLVENQAFREYFDSLRHRLFELDSHAMELAFMPRENED